VRAPRHKVRIPCSTREYRTRRGRVGRPTASGKSALAHALAFDHHDTVEILAVDAMTVYRGMDIGTAKPTRAERAEVSYHLLDLVEPSDEFTWPSIKKPHASRPRTSGEPATRSSTSAAPGSTVVRFWTTSRYRVSTRMFARCSKTGEG